MEPVKETVGFFFQEAGRNCLDRDTTDLNLSDSPARRHPSFFNVCFFGSFVEEDEDRDVKQRYSVKKSHVG